MTSWEITEILCEDYIGDSQLVTFRIKDGTYFTVYKRKDEPNSHADFTCSYHFPGHAQRGHLAYRMFIMLSEPLEKLVKLLGPALKWPS